MKRNGSGRAAPKPANGKRITDVACRCKVCGWTGTVGECEPDVDGDGSLGCLKCMKVVETEKI